MDIIRLKFKGISEVVGTGKMCLLVLTDMNERRQINVVCDPYVEKMFALRLRGKVQASRLLPEVLCDLLVNKMNCRFEIIINGVRDGQYRCVLVSQDTLDTLPIDISEAVLMSFISDTPLLISPELMSRQSAPYNEGSTGVSMPVNAISGEMLQHAMKKAIEDEDYELASQLRDEQKRRKDELQEDKNK